MKYFEIRIGQTIRPTPKSSPQHVDTIVETAFTIEEVENYLIGRYGYLPKGRNKIYRDTKAGDGQIVGFLHSFWKEDYINGPSYRQTDWIEIAEITKKVVLIHAKEGRKNKKNRVTLNLVDRVNIENIMYYYKIEDNNHERHKLVMEMLGEIEHLINERLAEGVGR